MKILQVLQLTLYSLRDYTKIYLVKPQKSDCKNFILKVIIYLFMHYKE